MCRHQPVLKELVHQLISENSFPLEMRNSVYALYHLFIKLGALDPLAQRNEVSVHLQLPSGRAIAPVQAGMCLFEISRTRVFVKGLIEAITDLNKQFPGRPIRVLDAGCGPFALLPLLATPYFTPDQVQFSVLDIHQINLESARTLVHNLELDAYFSSYIREDATRYQCNTNLEPDILISETMNRGLQKEPQAAITLHLAAQLPPYGILLPEKIEISLRMIQVAARSKFRFSPEPITGNDTVFQEELASLLCLNRHSTPEELARHPLATVSIPADYEKETRELELYTSITVYKENRLLPYDCSLTLPLLLEPNTLQSVKAGDQLDFYYSFHPVPGLEFTRQI